MPGPEFFTTRMGHCFYEATMPRIATALERIATALESQQQMGQGQADPSDIPPAEDDSAG